MHGAPNTLEVLRVLVEAHDRPTERNGTREPIMYFRTLGGGVFQHHGLDGLPDGVDEALLEEMYSNGVITIDYLERSWRITPTSYAREVIAESDRIESREPLADVAPLVAAVAAQSAASNPLAWPAVRPVLAALRTYWQDGGFSQHGVQLLPLHQALPENESALFAATVRSLLKGSYLETEGSLATSITDDSGRVTKIPGEVALTEKAHAVLDGWPGAAPEELVENLLAVLTVAAADESDPGRKRRLEKVADALRELGVSISSEVIAKVVTGGL